MMTWHDIILCDVWLHADSSRDTQMALVVSTSLRMEQSCGPVVLTTQCVCGICVKADSYSSMTLRLRSSHLATVPPGSGSPSGMFMPAAVSVILYRLRIYMCCSSTGKLGRLEWEEYKSGWQQIQDWRVVVLRLLECVVLCYCLICQVLSNLIFRVVQVASCHQTS